MQVVERTSSPSASGLPFDRVARKGATDAVLTEIRRQMLLGRLSPGDRLPSEREMATQFGVSRSSVRSAIAALDQIGVVEVRHGVGTFVSVDTTRLHTGILPWAIVRGVEGLHDLCEVRRHVEVQTAGLAAESRTSDALTTLGQ